MKNLSDLIESCIYDGMSIGTFRTVIQDLLKNTRNPLVVVSGWEVLRKSTPNPYSKYLDEVATTIIQAIPNKSTTLWFARPVPIAQNNKTYSSRCVTPYYQGALWQNFTDTIIWNVATSNSYHERAIFTESLGPPVEPKLIEIEPLVGWGEDFKTGGRKDKRVYQTGFSFSGTSSNYVKNQLDKAKTLIPHLLERNKFYQRPMSDGRLEFDHVTSGFETTQDLEPLLSFNPLQIYSQVTVDDSGVQVNVDGTDVQKGDGRVKLLLPITSIDRKREYKPMGLDVIPPKRSTRPPSEHYLSICEFDERKMAISEIRKLRDAITFLQLNDVNHLKELFDKLADVLDSIRDDGKKDDVDTLYNNLRHIHTILETNELSKKIWKRMLPFRSTIPRNLTETQKEHVTAIQKKHPDILMLIGNHLFLLILSALVQTPTVPFTTTLYVLWDYIQPWHLMGVGFRPVYPNNHNRGRSVLDRHKLLKRLEQLTIKRNMALEQQSSVTNVRYGQVIGWLPSEDGKSKYLWLIFQRTPGNYDTNAALLNPKGMDSSLSIHQTLLDMVSERTYWSESDLGLLGRYAKLQGDEFRLPVMIADQYGSQVLWIADGEYDRWKPIGHLKYGTRKFEDVTLVRTITLSGDPHLKPVEYSDVRRPIHTVGDLVDPALYILNKELEGCTYAKCKVSLDEDERMYRVTFTEQNSGESLGELLINRTADLLEILRRPDNDCEPVIVNGKRLIWNRFGNVSYDDNIALVTPWVNRSNPFPGMLLKLPPSASGLLDARKEYDVTMELYHDAWTCPMRNISMEVIEEGRQQAQKFSDYHLFRRETHWAEPERISNEPGMHHGSCWRVHVDTPQKLTTGLKELMEVRLTDAQARALLRSQELVYEDLEEKEWVIHTFGVIIKKKSVKESKESWHIQKLLKDLMGKKDVTSVYRGIPDKWSPYFILYPDHVIIGLEDKENRDITLEKKIHECNVALRKRSEVFTLLKQEMEKFLKSKGILSDRRLKGAIRTEIEYAMEIAGVVEDKAKVEFDNAIILPDSVGGRVLYIFFKHTDHKIAVTPHLHDIKKKIKKGEFMSDVKSILSEYNLSEEAMEEAVEACLSIMRGKELIKR